MRLQNLNQCMKIYNKEKERKQHLRMNLNERWDDFVFEIDNQDVEYDESQNSSKN